MSSYDIETGHRQLQLQDMEGGLLSHLLFSTAAFTGDEFFDALTRDITSQTNLRIACVSELLLDVSRARVVSAHRNGERLEPLEYELSGTPCEVAVRDGVAIYERAVTHHFPQDLWLGDVRAEAYVAAPLRSRSGVTIGLVSVIHDAQIEDGAAIALLLEGLAPRVAAELERKQRQDALGRSEARLRFLAEYSRDALFYERLLPIPVFEYVSPAIETITGYPPEAFLANADMAVQIVHEEDRAKIGAAISSGGEEPFTLRLIRADGATRWIEYSFYAFLDDHGRATALCGSMRDITARIEGTQALRVSEQYRSALISAMPDTVFRLDAAGTILDYVSGDASRVVPAMTNGITGRNVRELLPPPMVAPILQVVRSSLQTGKLERAEFEVAGSGQALVFEGRCIPFTTTEVLLVLRDVTAIKWHEGEEDRKRFRDELDVKVERQRANSYGLTYRELAILHLVAEGQADKQIAESLGISTYTVNKHVGNILGKMAASSRTEAGVRAIREGLVG